MTLKTCLAFLCLLTPAWARASLIEGKLVDQSGAAIPSARIGVYSPTGLLLETQSDAAGQFRIDPAPSDADHLIVAAQGFQTASVSVSAQPLVVQLSLAPVSDSVRVIGSTIDTPGAEQASSVGVITGTELRERNEATVGDYLRLLPGITVLQTGASRGSFTAVSIRGGDTDSQLVEIDGMPVNSFNGGGWFDFSQVQPDMLDRIEVVRGAQSALYGSYASSGAVNFVTRAPTSEPAFDIVAEGGSHQENREVVSGSGAIGGWGVSAALARVAANGEVPNGDFETESVEMRLNRNWGRQSFSAGGVFDANQVGDPGPYGSDPLGLYGGLDLISRDKNNVSEYHFNYQADLTARLRGELFGGFFLDNNFYASPYGNSFNKDIRGQGEGRLTSSINPWWTMAGGVVWAREEVKNTFITDNDFRSFPLRRDEEGIYWENRLSFRRLYLQLGVRGEIYNTADIPAYQDSFTNRPEIPAHTDSRVNPKVAASYRFPEGTALHASFGTGIRPPGGSDLAFTDNPDLKPERTVSVDAGITQKLLGNRLILDATFFDIRYTDLIVGLGGSLANLSAFSTANLANARTRGLETSAQFRPARWMFLSANYTFLDTAVLALDHSSIAQAFFTVGQQLPRRPPHSGSFRLNLSRGRVSGDLIGYIRGDLLDVEPNFGTSAGLFTNPGYAYLEANLNLRVSHGLTAYGTLRNALDQRYEEVFGFPSPRLNFVSGLKWSLRGRDF